MDESNTFVKRLFALLILCFIADVQSFYLHIKRLRDQKRWHGTIQCNIIPYKDVYLGCFRSRILPLYSKKGDEPKNHEPQSLQGRSVDVCVTEEFSTNKKLTKSKRKKLRKKIIASISDSAIDEKAIGHHVSSEYLNGKDGLFYRAELKRKKLEKNDQTRKDQLAYLRKLDNKPCLVLNADYQPLSHLPLSLWTWQETIKSVFAGKVTVVDVYPNVFIKAVNLQIPLPSVIALNEYAPVNSRNMKPAFTRRNVFLRDRYRCQYCNNLFRMKDLTLDHVKPRCNGGRLDWENAVSCCPKCNGRKGSLELHELSTVGMKLVKMPRIPSSYELAALAGQMLPKKVHPTWEPFLPSLSNSERGLSQDGSTSATFLAHES